MKKQRETLIYQYLFIFLKMIST
ncbi:hypothetical protein FNL10_05170 [Staphylococcus hominis]|nr:hypothetical protein FNL10_05170 [Staphylococcus hominis]